MAKRRPAVLVEPPPGGAGVPVLTARGGRVRGKLVLRNQHSEPVSVPDLQIRASDDLDAPLVEDWRPQTLQPGEAGRVDVTASVDRRTPPGEYKVELDVDGVVQPAVLLVVEDISLTVSERELVVAGDVGIEQSKTVVLTNRGNVPLEVSRIGPVELAEDRPQPTLLERLGVLAPPADRPAGTLLQRMGVVAYLPEAATPEEREECKRDRENEPCPTLAAHLRKPLTILPGEVATTEWIVSVEGPVRPGLRYRATAPLYTSDITFVVTPSQKWRDNEDQKPRTPRQRAPRQRAPRRRTTR